MSKKVFIHILLATFLPKSIFCQEIELRGSFELDTLWQSKIYISRIHDFNEMYTASDKLIHAYGEIDSLGNFKIRFNGTISEMLYRAHLIKRGDPVSTLIIGGNDENHFFFIAKGNDQIEIVSHESGNSIDHYQVDGNYSSVELNLLLRTLKSSDLSREDLKDSLISIADTSKSELVRLLAIHYTFGLNLAQKERIEKLLTQMDENNIYGTRIFAEYFKPINYLILFLLAFIILIAGSVAIHMVLKNRQAARILSLLSQRETSIAICIIQGHANKEIASLLNIELSTVKTHVNNIYSKLKINNRKDLLKYKRFFNDLNK